MIGLPETPLIRKNYLLITNKLKYSPLVRGASHSALDDFSKTSFPNRKDEQWKYSPLKKIKKHPFTNNSSFTIKNINPIVTNY